MGCQFRISAEGGWVSIAHVIHKDQDDIWCGFGSNGILAAGSSEKHDGAENCDVLEEVAERRGWCVGRHALIPWPGVVEGTSIRAGFCQKYGLWQLSGGVAENPGFPRRLAAVTLWGV